MTILRNLLNILVFFILGINISRAEIYVDIDSGNVNPIPIAIMNFSGSDKELSSVGKNITSVITNDLKRSGLFSPISQSAFVDKKQDMKLSPTFENWTVINAMALVYGNVEKAEDDKVRVEFQLWDVVGQMRLEGQVLLTEKIQLAKNCSYNC